MINTNIYPIKYLYIYMYIEHSLFTDISIYLFFNVIDFVQ